VVLGQIAARGRAAIVVGGTGLYFRALTQGLAETPPTPPAVAQAAERLFVEQGEEAVRAALRAVDPAAETRIGAGDRQRLTRALGVVLATGRALSAWQAETRPSLAADAWRGVVIAPPRASLYARCDARLTAMVRAGAVEEAAALMARGLDAQAPVMKAVGLRELALVAQNAAPLSMAVEAAQIATRRYAKRQLTWFRGQTPDWPRIDAEAPDAQWGQFLALFPDLTTSHAHGI
jgi:tRNA dimethylallyltransferase